MNFECPGGNVIAGKKLYSKIYSESVFYNYVQLENKYKSTTGAQKTNAKTSANLVRFVELLSQLDTHPDPDLAQTESKSD